MLGSGQHAEFMLVQSELGIRAERPSCWQVCSFSMSVDPCCGWGYKGNTGGKKPLLIGEGLLVRVTDRINKIKEL